MDRAKQTPLFAIYARFYAAANTWGRFAFGSFEAEVEGTRLRGEVTTGFLEVDIARDRWLAGVALGESQGDGTYELIDGEHRGEIESSLTAVYPYARFSVLAGQDPAEVFRDGTLIEHRYVLATTNATDTLRTVNWLVAHLAGDEAE